MKRFILFLLFALAAMFLLSACSATPAAIQKIVELPVQLQVLIAAAVGGLVALALRGRVPDEYISEISASITTALLTIIGVALRLIPLGLEDVAKAILNLIVVLLGSFWVVGLLRKGAVRIGVLKA